MFFGRLILLFHLRTPYILGTPYKKPVHGYGARLIPGCLNQFHRPYAMAAGFGVRLLAEVHEEGLDEVSPTTTSAKPMAC